MCVAANKVCDGLRATASVGLYLARKAVKGLSYTFDAAKGALTGLQKTVDATKFVWTNALKSLSFVKGVWQGTVDIFNKIVKFGLNGLFSIKEIKFDAKLENAALGKFSLSISAKILGKSETLKIRAADVHDITNSIVKPIARRIGIKI